MRGNLSNDMSRSNSSHLFNENEIKKLFPFTQQQHNKYLQQNRLQNIKDELTHQQQQTIAFQIKDLLIKDKTRSKNNLDELIQQTTPRIRTKERTISVNRKQHQPIQYHDAQNINLHNKNVRRELVQLAQWFDFMVNQVQQSQSSMNYVEYFNKIEVIFSGSVLELQRQFQQKSYEGSQFLRKMWDSFLMNIQYIIEGLSAKANQIEQQSLDEIHKLHEWYQESMAKQINQILLLKDEINLITIENQQVIRENQYLRKKDAKREKLLKELIFEKDHNLLEIIELKGQQQLFQKPTFGELIQYQNRIYDYFKNQCENHMKTMELQYRNLQLQDTHFDHAQDLLLKEKACQVVGLITAQDQSTTMNENSFVSVATQTHKQKRFVDEETQVQPITNTQETQVAVYQIKRDKLIRNSYEQQIVKFSTLHLEDIIDQYQESIFPLQELIANDPIYLEKITEEINKESKQTVELLDVVNIRNDISPKDFVCLKDYISKQYQEHSKNYFTIWSVVMDQQTQVMDKIIEKQDSQIELEEVKMIFKNNMEIVKQFQAKFEEEQKISQFYSNSLIKIIRYAPQFVINQIQEQAQHYNVLQGVEFKEMRKKTNITDSRMLGTPQSQSNYSKYSPLKGSQISYQSQGQIPSLKQITQNKQLKAQGSFEIEVDIPQELRDLQEDSQSNSSKDDDEPEAIGDQMARLKLDFVQQEPELSLEKKLRINTCPMKSAPYTTQILKQILKKFKRNNMKGLYTLTTLIQYYTEFVLKKIPYNQNTPLHVHLYEHIVQRFGQSLTTDHNKYKRMIKSFLFYEHRHITCTIVVKFLKGQYDVQDFNNYLEIMEQCKNYPNIGYSHFISVINSWLVNNHYEEEEIQKIMNEINQSEISYLKNCSSPTEFDLVIDYFFSIFEKYKNRTSKKYCYLFQSIDVLQKDTINFQQWNCIYETIIQRNYSFSQKLFYQEADYHNKERLMSKQRFTVVSDELQIFTLEEQEIFLDHQSFEDIFHEIKIKWKQQEIAMKICFIKAKKYDKFIKSLCQTIDRNIQTSQQIESSCYTYKLLQKISKAYYIDWQIPNFINSGYQEINEKIRTLEERQLCK